MDCMRRRSRLFLIGKAGAVTMAHGSKTTALPGDGSDPAITRAFYLALARVWPSPCGGSEASMGVRTRPDLEIGKMLCEVIKSFRIGHTWIFKPSRAETQE